MALSLPPALTALVDSQCGVFTREQAIACGVSPDELRRAVATRGWLRVRRGAYVDAQRWQGADDRTRQIMRLSALTLRAEAPVVGSHETAAAVLGLELWEPSYEWLDVTRSDHSARREAGVWHHKATLHTREVERIGGLQVTGALRTALDLARRSDFEHGVVAVDSALRLSGAGTARLLALHLRCLDWPGARNAGRAVAFADERAASVGESRLRVKLALADLPEPLSQVAIYDETERWCAVVDFLLDGKVILEFDGLVKYGLDGLAPEVVSERLFREKQREDTLRRLGYEVVRFTWADLYHLERIISYVRAALDRASMSPPVRGVQRRAPVREAAVR